jgi:hypothetical protein
MDADERSESWRNPVRERRLGNRFRLRRDRANVAGRDTNLGAAERDALTALEHEEVGRPIGSDGFAGAVDGIQYRPWQWALLHR